jgi:hypothetical protein
VETWGVKTPSQAGRDPAKALLLNELNRVGLKS